MSFKRWWMVPSLCLVMAGFAHAGGEYVGERNSFNRFHGKGMYTYTNGSVYEGQWVDGRKQGQGRQTQPDGSVYVGEWRDNLQNGKGRMRWASGDVYEGEWSDGHMHGRGVYTSANGDRYEGNFVVDQREGSGVLTRRNGERFDGRWKEGLRDGKGTLTKPGVGVIVGQWSGDMPAGKMTVTFSGGDRFVGALQNDLPHGKGTCASKSGSSACEYKEGKLQLAETRPVAKPTPAPAVAAAEPTGAVAPAAVPADAQAGRSSIVNKTPGAAKPVTQADIIRRTAALQAVNTAPAPAAGIPPESPRALLTQAPQFAFMHDWDGNLVSSNALPVVYAAKDSIQFGDMKIRAEGGDVAVTLVVDEYTGPGVYPLKYFKASIAKEGVASYQTAAAEPGEIHVTFDDGKVLKGTFRFVGYRNGNPATQEKKSVSEGLFVVPVRDAASSAK